MHIAFIALDYPSALSGGGVGNQVRTLGLALVEAGHQVTVIALAEPGSAEYCEDQGIQVYRVRRSNVHWYISKVPGFGPLLVNAIREFEDSWAAYSLVRKLHRGRRFDVIEGTENGSLCAALWLSRVPLVIRLHGERYTLHRHTPGLSLTRGLRLGRALQRLALRRARLLISPSRAHACEIEGELGGRRPRIVVVPNTLSFTDLC